MKTGYYPRSPYIEYLENRIAPATFIVTNVNDAGAGSLRQAVLDANASPGADTILFRGDASNGEINLSTGEILITDNINIKGPGAGKLTINAQNLSRIFHINDGTAAVKNVTISGLSMIEGNSGAGSFGGGIRSLESLTLVNSLISGCQASGSAGYGGGLYAITDGKLVIQGCKIIGNTAAGCGGGLSIVADRGIQILNSVVSGNTAARCGGGVYATILDGSTGDILISGSVITDNTAARGGGIQADNNRLISGNSIGKITIRDTLVAGNSATLASIGIATEGGGIHLDNGRALIERCTINNNVATDDGGGLSTINIESLAIRGSKITNNHTTSFTGIGGGTYIGSDGKNVIIQKTLISSNVSSGDGGGVFSINNRLTIQQSTISGNTAADAGGGVYAKQGALNIDRSTIRDNQSGGPGGGISTMGTDTDRIDLRISNSLITANRAASGGGVDTNGDGSVTVAGSRFVQNFTTSGAGGGLNLRSNLGPLSITGSLIMQNTAGDDGGGIAFFRSGTSPITITNSIISQNFAAGDDGGGVAVLSGTLSLRTSQVIGNVAVNQGGGIFSDVNFVALNGSRITGNVAPFGAQIYGGFTP
jgi:hypothetical protein